MFVDCSTDFRWLSESQLTSPPRNSTPKPRCRNTEEWQQEYRVLFDTPRKGRIRRQNSARPFFWPIASQNNGASAEGDEKILPAGVQTGAGHCPKGL